MILTQSFFASSAARSTDKYHGRAAALPSLVGNLAGHRKTFEAVRAGRPSRRCPGFDCQFEAERRYQQSPERREYRKLSMRLHRAQIRGDANAIREAERQLAEHRLGGSND